MEGDAISLIAAGGPWGLLAASVSIAWRFFTLYQASTEKRIEEAGNYKVLAEQTKNTLTTLSEVIKAATQPQGNGK